METGKTPQPVEQPLDPDDILRRLLAMPPQPKKGKAEKDKLASK
jgi:hypothetical protein